MSSPKVTLSLVARDSDNVNIASVTLKVDGAPVKPIVQYAPVDESTDDYTTLQIYYPAVFSTGLHTAEISVQDGLKNTSTLNWTFAVAGQPQFLRLEPADGSTVGSLTPPVKAYVSSPENIDPGTVVMTLNGAPVTAFFDQSGGIIGYTPATPLVNETFYNITLTFKDKSGKALNTSWRFYVNTFHEMTFPLNDAACRQCHDSTAHLMTNCSYCHGVNNDAANPTHPVDDCYFCHFGNQRYPLTYHMNGLPAATNQPGHPVQVTYSCIECHYKSWSVQIPQVHSVFDTAIRHITSTTGCTGCHSSSLTREHRRRTDSAGNPLTCLTCHNSPDQNVQNAIQSKNSSCNACHAGSGDLHHSTGKSCLTCHRIHG